MIYQIQEPYLWLSDFDIFLLKHSFISWHSKSSSLDSLSLSESFTRVTPPLKSCFHYRLKSQFNYRLNSTSYLLNPWVPLMSIQTLKITVSTKSAPPCNLVDVNRYRLWILCPCSSSGLLLFNSPVQRLLFQWNLITLWLVCLFAFIVRLRNHRLSHSMLWY